MHLNRNWRRIFVLVAGVYAYLQVIVLGLRGLKIEEGAQEILAHLSRLQGDLDRFKKDFELVGGHLENARNRYEEAYHKLGRFEDRLAQLEATPEEPD